MTKKEEVLLRLDENGEITGRAVNTNPAERVYRLGSTGYRVSLEEYELLLELAAEGYADHFSENRYSIGVNRGSLTQFSRFRITDTGRLRAKLVRETNAVHV